MAKRRKRTVRRKKRKAIKQFFDRKGFLTRVTNPKGRGRAVIVQRGGPAGFTALALKNKKFGRKIAFSRSAEALARRLARKGKKEVIFAD